MDGALLAPEVSKLVSEAEPHFNMLLAPLEFKSLIPDALESCRVADFFLGEVTVRWVGLVTIESSEAVWFNFCAVKIENL